jgi:diaminopimelate decarboxylase
MFRRDEDGRARLGDTLIEELLQQAGCGTPAYLYDIDAIRTSARALRESFGQAPHLVAYAVKANSSGSILRALVEEGCGADVVSGGELALALSIGLAPKDIVFSGVAKRDDEIDRALLSGDSGIYAIQLESLEELDRVAARARSLSRAARVSIRINPSIVIDAHAHVATGHDAAKFGVLRHDLGHAWEALAIHPELKLVGLSTHIGSTQTSTEPYLAAARIVFDIARGREARSGPLEFIDCGGGFGIDYGQGCPVTPADFGRALARALTEERLSHLRLVVEPGRSLVGSHGVLVASVIQTKYSPNSGRRWLMIDAGMNDLVRPALYQARHRIEPISAPPSAALASYRVVGPICESTDDFGVYDLPSEPPPRVVIRDAGAYGFAMASQYNGRSLPAEIFVSGGAVVHISPPTSTESWIRSRLES